MKHIEILKLRNTIIQINKSVNGFNSRLDTAEEWIINMEDKPEENKMQHEKQKVEMWRNQLSDSVHYCRKQTYKDHLNETI